jgi:hypothetical protein
MTTVSAFSIAAVTRRSRAIPAASSRVITPLNTPRRYLPGRRTDFDRFSIQDAGLVFERDEEHRCKLRHRMQHYDRSHGRTLSIESLHAKITRSIRSGCRIPTA